MNKEIIHINSFSNSWGTIHSACSDRGLAILTLPSHNADYFEESMLRTFPDAKLLRGGGISKVVQQQVQRYLQGELTKFDLPLDLRCSPFHAKALREVARIPYGKTRSYGEIAERIGHPRAARAVGTANAKNPIPLVIPCHRVVASNGLGGFGGGMRLKEKLLRLEGAL